MYCKYCKKLTHIIRNNVHICDECYQNIIDNYSLHDKIKHYFNKNNKFRSFCINDTKNNLLQIKHYLYSLSAYTNLCYIDYINKKILYYEYGFEFSHKHIVHVLKCLGFINLKVENNILYKHDIITNKKYPLLTLKRGSNISLYSDLLKENITLLCIYSLDDYKG